MTEQEIRAAVNRWSKGQLLRPKLLGDQMVIQAVAEIPAIIIRLHTQYEERTVSRKQESLPNAPLHKAGEPMDLATILILPPTGFEAASTEARVPNSERVEKCQECLGIGSRPCQICGGAGKKRCSFCGGSGRRTTFQTRHVPRPDGRGVVIQTQPVSTWCGSCQGGWVTCGNCQMGKERCGRCLGSGELLTFDSLTVHFRPASATEVVNATGVPNDLLKDAEGQLLFDQEPPASGRVDLSSPEVCSRLEAMLDTSRKKQLRIVRQRLRIDQVPVFRVGFTAPKIGEGHMWIYGTDHTVHAPDVHSSGIAGKLSRWFS